MEVLLSCFFENFEQLERNTLHARYKRRALVEYFNTLVEGCRLGLECDAETVVREAIVGILGYHETSKRNNGGICLMGNYHNILYVGVKLCHDWQLKDTVTVAALLDHIFECERTFERLIVGAIFGTKAPHYIAGWKSDFDSQEENTRAVAYFLDHATKASLEYHVDADDPCLTRFIDVPIESCGRTTALNIVVQLGLPDKLHILLRFGALIIAKDEDDLATGLLLARLYEFKGCYPYNLVACFQLLLRVLPSINIASEGATMPGSNVQSNAILDRYPKLVEDGIIPRSRCGLETVELKHLCRCRIRHALWKNYQIPQGIRRLPVPNSLHRYLDLLED